MPNTVARSIVRQLEAREVPRIYQVPGESFLGLLDALHDSPIRLVTARQEGGAGFMALAEGRLTGRAGVAMVTRGPGAANLSIAIHTAYQDATPLVAFVGLIPTSDRDKEAFQEFDPRAWFGSTTKAVMILDDPDSAGESVARAFDLAEAGRPGPVVIGLPEERLREATDVQDVFPAIRVQPLRPTPEGIAEVRVAFERAERPVFVIGGDDWNRESATQLRRIAEAMSVPVVSDFRAHDNHPHSSAAWVGSLGFKRSEAAAAAYEEADLVCYLGAVRSDVMSDGYTLGRNAPRTYIVTKDPDLRARVGGAGAHFTMSTTDWMTALEAEALPASAARADRLSALRESYVRWSTPPQPESDELTPESIYGVLAQVLPDDSIFTLGAGNYALAAQRYLHHEVPRSLVGPRNGAMGMGMPAAVAASLVFPERTVVALAGDGCFGMNGTELASLASVEGRALVFILDNGGYGTIRSHQEREFPGRRVGTTLVNPDFAALGRAYGLDAWTFTTLDGFAERLAAAVSSRRSTVFHLRIPQLPPSAK
ncbi:thiamine pyrophosphate-binding protein [Leucobacter sp. GX24907]